MKVRFKCPNCRGTQLEEILVDVVQSSVITDIEEDGYLDYEGSSTSDGTVDDYQCSNCGWRIPLNSSLAEDLFEWLKDNGMLEKENQTREEIIVI